MDPWLLILIFAAIWAATFWPAWKLFMVLASEVVRPGTVRWARLVWIFVVYRLVIAAPYLAVLVLGSGTLGPIISGLLVGLIILGLVTSLLRLFATQTVLGWLWRIYANVYDGLLFFYPYRHLLELQANRIRVGANAHIIDLGCGSGNMLPLLAAQFPKAAITAVDPTPGMLRRAERKAKTLGREITFKQSDGLAFLRTVPDASVDAVVMSNVLYTFDNRKDMWPELLRTLKPGGMAVITNSDRPGSGAIIKEHLRHDAWWRLLHPKLLMTGIVDAFISELSKVGAFHFVDQKTLQKEVTAAGGIISDPVRCYGGEVDGVNLLFTVTRR
ncbi:MAG TPA: class I SAM-dependent methyltransferase [Candidatus Saccharimonadales bacterium]|nr:class I SAM-dependent methyltransferase [Candidatus Saccharimonadales bacterium]